MVTVMWSHIRPRVGLVVEAWCLASSLTAGNCSSHFPYPLLLIWRKKKSEFTEVATRHWWQKLTGTRFKSYSCHLMAKVNRYSCGGLDFMLLCKFPSNCALLQEFLITIQFYSGPSSIFLNLPNMLIYIYVHIDFISMLVLLPIKTFLLFCIKLEKHVNLCIYFLFA